MKVILIPRSSRGLYAVEEIPAYAKKAKNNLFMRLFPTLKRYLASVTITKIKANSYELKCFDLNKVTLEKKNEVDSLIWIILKDSKATEQDVEVQYYE